MDTEAYGKGLDELISMAVGELHWMQREQIHIELSLAYTPFRF